MPLSNCRGLEVEDYFFKLINRTDLSARKATTLEQFKHIDVVSRLGKIDVKSMKSVKRGKGIQDEFTWIEFKGNKGRPGWIYGQADFIAFERQKDFVLVNRNVLLSFAEQKCDLSTSVAAPELALYKSYTRKGKKDVISLVKMEDLVARAAFFFDKLTF